jgi:4-hydroxybenzoate-CoA ligase/benzoate-CoA ligase
MNAANNNAAAHFVDRHQVAGSRDQTAFIDADGVHSYSALARAVNRAGHALRRLGVAQGDRVMLCLNDGLAFPAAFFGALKLGAVPVPINTLLTAADYGYMLRDCAPKAIVVSAALLERIGPALPGAIDAGRILISGHSESSYPSLEAALTASPDQLDAIAVASDDTGFWLYSSGSTGGPKGVLHRHRDLIATARLYGEAVLGLTRRDVVLSASKLFFAYGLGNSSTFPLYAGATAILMAERPTPAAVLAALRHYRVTLFFGFPTLYAAILASLEDPATEPLEHLRLCVSAGEALPPAVAQRWRACFGVPILDGIGSTEALHIFISNRPGDARDGASGTPVAGYDVELRGEDGSLAGVDQIADLWCRGPSIASGYWNQPEATKRTFVEGWLRTGDKYWRDADGYYHYAGRADDMLKVGGVWVSPNEVEAALIEHPAVLEAAVVGHADADALIKPKAFVVLKDPDTASSAMAEQIAQFVRTRIAPYKRPHWIEFRAELPKTATGKIRRNVLRDAV